MAKTWQTVPLTGGKGTAPVPGVMLLPQGTSPIRQLIVKSSKAGPRLVPGGVRSDAGNGALVDGALLAVFGGEDKSVQYRAASRRDVLRFGSSARLQLTLAIVSFALTILSAYAAYQDARSGSSGTVPFSIVAAIFALGCLGAVLKVWQDTNTALH